LTAARTTDSAQEAFAGAAAGSGKPGPSGGGARPARTKVIPIRHWGRAVIAAIILFLAFLLLYSLARNPNIDWPHVRDYLFADLVLRGVSVTLELTIIAMAMGIVGGTLLAVMRLSKNYVLSTVSWAYIWFFRGTPVYVQILLWGNFGILYPKLFVGLPFTHEVFASVDSNRVISIFVAATLALGLNEAAYAAELVRAGIISVDKGQSEAAHSLGMSPSLTMRLVILPQSMRVIVPPLGNETIGMLKTTALVAVISGHELMSNIAISYSQNFLVLPLLVVACIWYIFITTPLTIGQHYLEAYFGKGFGEHDTKAAERKSLRRSQRTESHV
jgi:polar amino acid transport system permease protein